MEFGVSVNIIPLIADLKGTNFRIVKWRRFLSYRNQSTHLQSISLDWFLYDRDLCHERVHWNLVTCLQRKFVKQFTSYLFLPRFKNLLSGGSQFNRKIVW